MLDPAICQFWVFGLGSAKVVVGGKRDVEEQESD